MTIVAVVRVIAVARIVELMDLEAVGDDISGLVAASASIAGLADVDSVKELLLLLLAVAEVPREDVDDDVSTVVVEGAVVVDATAELELQVLEVRCAVDGVLLELVVHEVEGAVTTVLVDEVVDAAAELELHVLEVGGAVDGVLLELLVHEVEL